MNYADIRTRHAAGQTAEQIAAALTVSPLTVHSIPKAALRQWLAETGLLRCGVNGWTGWLTGLIESSSGVEAVLNWLCDALANPAIDQIRTESDEQVATAFAAIVSAATGESAPAGCPLTVEQINTQLASWTGGRKYTGVTAEQVQAVIDRHERDSAVGTLVNDVYGAIGLAIENPEHTLESVAAAVQTVLTPEGE